MTGWMDLYRARSRSGTLHHGEGSTADICGSGEDGSCERLTLSFRVFWISNEDCAEKKYIIG